MLGGLDYHSIAVAVKRALTALGQLVTAAVLAPSTMGFSMINGKLVPSQNGTVLTVAIKTQAGNDPSASDPVYILFRSATSTTGDYTVITLIAPTSISTTVGGTFGVANSVAFRLWVVGFNDGGTFRLALINCLTTSANAGSGRNADAIFPLAGWGIASATQIGAGSVLSQTFYSFGAAVAAKAYATLGYLGYEAGLAAAGTFGVDQSRTQLFGPGVPLPTQPIQSIRTQPGAVISGTGAIPIDDTIPQNTEGTQAYSLAITPSSAANVLNITGVGFATQNTGGGQHINFALFVDAVANAVAAGGAFASTDGTPACVPMRVSLLASTIAAVKMRFANASGATTYFNGFSGGSRVYGGVAEGSLQIDEVMA